MGRVVLETVNLAFPIRHRAQDIARWASQVDAPAVLPRLVRRLLNATTRARSLNIPVDEQVHRPGPDGVVVVEAGNAYCPDGMSLWEFTTRGDMRKLREDFQKRTGDADLGLSRRNVTYVGVSARVLNAADKSRFHENDEQKVWADVRLLDAEDLAGWMELAPAVSAWFGGYIDTPLADLLDLETFIDEWRSRVDPPLPQGVLLMGNQRQAVVSQLLRWLDEGQSRFVLNASDRAEALAFAACAIRGREEWAARSVVVQSKEAMRWLKAVHRETPMVVLPAYVDFEPGHVAPGHRMLLPTSERLQQGVEGASLDPLPPGLLHQELQRAGFRDAERFARESGGHVGALLRMLGHSDLPVWATGLPQPALVAMLLMGTWDPDNQADREVAEELAQGADVGQVCELLASSQERPINHAPTRWGGRSVFAWASRKDAWNLLGHLLAHSKSLELFFQIVKRVLGTDDPRFELPNEDRFSAAILGKVLPHSDYLRSGLAESLVFLGQATDDRARWRAESSVAELLEPKGVRWASVSDVLPLLAEAAPGRWLLQFDALSRTPVELSWIFAQETSLGAAPHTRLLWALERLAWDKESVAATVRALGQLASSDPGGSLANRPERSLHAILHPLMPQSATNADDRIRHTQQLLERTPTVGWQLALAVLDDARGGVVTPTARPTFRGAQWDVPADPRSAPPNDARRQLTETLELVLQHVGTDEHRWVDVVDRIRFLPHQTRNRITQMALERTRSDEMRSLRIWDALRKSLHLSKWGSDPELTQWLAEAYRQLEPTDPIDQIEWLFRGFPDLPEEDKKLDYNKKQQLLAKARVAAVERLWDTDVLPRSLVSLAERVDGGALGSAIASSRISNDYEVVWTSGPQPVALSAGFVGRRAHDRGLRWLLDAVAQLTSSGRADEALRCLLLAKPCPETWSFIDSHPTLAHEYWSQATWFGADHLYEDLRIAISKLIFHKRPFAALDAAAYSVKKLSGQEAMEVLTRVKEAIVAGNAADAANSMTSHNVEELFERIDGSDLRDSQDLLGVELMFLDTFRDGARPPMALYEALTDPKFFVHMLTLLYRAESNLQDGTTLPSEAKQNAARNAFRILDAWKTYPGQGMATREASNEKLKAWTAEVVSLGRAEDRYRVTISELAKVLARPSAGLDDIWPCEPARDLLEEGTHADFEDSLIIARRNMRGVVTKAVGEGGRQERSYAEGLRRDANKLDASYPATARLLRKLSTTYEQEANAEDKRGEAERREYSQAPRSFDSTREFELAVADLYDEFAVASLVVLLARPFPDIELRSEPPSAGARIAAGWYHPDRRRVEAGWVDLAALKSAVPSGEASSSEVLYLNDKAPLEVRQWTLEALGYAPEIPGQVEGCWIEEDNAVPSSTEPTHAVLFETSNDDGLALLLKKVDAEWRPIGQEELPSISFLERGYRFVAMGSDESRTSRTFRVQELQELSRSDLQGRFPAVPKRRYREHEAFVAAKLEAAN